MVCGDMATNLRSGIVKQVISGDSIIIRDKPKNGPPHTKIIVLSNIIAPKFGQKQRSGEETKEQPYAWEVREFLRKKLVGQEVFFSGQPIGDNTMNNREYGHVYFPTKDDSIAEELVANGLASVKSEGARQPTPEVLRLIELEKKAKQEGKGKWAPNAKTTGRNVIQVTDKVEQFVKNHAKKSFNAIIENVLSGSTVKALLLPDFYEITLLISGIRCEPPNGGDGLEAKFFVECRLLQQDVQVVIETYKSNNIAGSIIHPKGDIAELLLKEGFASCVDWSMVTVTNGAERLRAAERYAKEKRLRRWKDWEPSGPKISNKEFSGIVNEIIGGEGLIIKLPSGELKKVFLASIKLPRLDTRKENEDPSSDVKPPVTPTRGRSIFDVPWLFEAREFLREKIIGKKVNVVVDYIQPERDTFPEKLCCTVFLGKLNLAEALVAQGLATVLPHRQDDENRSSFYDALTAAQQKAKENSLGLHNKKDIPKHRINDLTGNPSRAKGLIPILQRVSRLEAVVEYVVSGSRMRLYIKRDAVIITFLLSGIDCPRAGVPARSGGFTMQPQPFGEEALKFAKDKIMQRDVEIKIESCDKAGNMIGWLFVNNVNLAIAMVEEGFAKVHGPSAERSEYYRALINAEEAAKAAKLNIWSLPQEEIKEQTIDDAAERAVDYKNVRIEVITPELHVFAQHIEDENALIALTQELRTAMSSYTPAIDYRPKKGELCAAKYIDDEWYRGKVQKLIGQKAQILYVDYGNAAEVSVKDLAPLPLTLGSNKPFAHEYGIACGKAPPKEYVEDTLNGFHKQLSGRLLAINVEYYDQNLPYVSIIDPETKDDEIKKAISQGLFLVANRREKKLQSMIEEYTAAQAEAKKKHLVIWEYGDITDDDAKEFGYIK